MKSSKNKTMDTEAEERKCNVVMAFDSNTASVLAS